MAGTAEPTQDVIVLDDDDEVEMSAPIPTPSPETPRSRRGRPTTDLRTPSANSKCINYLCETNEATAEFLPAPVFCLEYYMTDIKTKKEQKVCQPCWTAAVQHFENLSAAYYGGTATFDVHMPVRHQVVQLGDSDSDEEGIDPDDVFIEGEALQYIKDTLPSIMADIISDPILDTQIQLNKDYLENTIASIGESFGTTNSAIIAMRKKLDKMMFDTNALLQPIITELDPLDIVEEPFNAPLTPPPSIASSTVRHSPRLGVPQADEISPLTLDIEAQITLPSNLPKLGVFVRKHFVGSEMCYAKRLVGSGAWVKVRIVAAFPPGPLNTAKAFTILDLADNSKRAVRETELAYSQPSLVVLGVGVRVLASGTSTTNIRRNMFPGVIGETLSGYNRYRYLIFFEDGYASYVEHTNVVPIYRQSTDVWEDIAEDARPFIEKYLKSYPNRPMVQLQKGQEVRTEFNGKWWMTTVLNIDCSVVQMAFGHGKKPEWIYRGSSRLNPIYDEERAASNRSANKQRTPRKVLPAGQYVQYTRDQTSPSPSIHLPLTPSSTSSSGITLTSILSTPPLSANQLNVSSPTQQRASSMLNAQLSSINNNNATQQSTAVPTTAGRSTARKSTRMSVSVGGDTINTNSYDIASVRNFLPAGGGLKAPPPSKIVFYKPRKQSPNAQLYQEHYCSSKCNSKTSNMMNRLKGYAPLAKPLICGFYRLEFRLKGKKYICYKAPCGRALRNMHEVHKYLTITDNFLSVDLFNFDHFIRCLAEYQIQPNNAIIKDLSLGQEQVAIPVVNNHNNDFLPFCNYSTKRNPMEGVNLNLNPDFLCGCDCLDDCADRSKCACWKMTLQCLKYMDKDTDPNQIGYQYRRLIDPIMTGIYECNSRCKCKKTCLNRLVQHGLQHKLQVFKTENRGWGIRCLNDIPIGTFICIYAGALLTNQMANEGGKSYGDEYFAELDFIEIAEKFKEDYEEDANSDDAKSDKEHVSDEEAVVDDDLNVSMYQPDKEFRPYVKVDKNESAENIRTRLRDRSKRSVPPTSPNRKAMKSTSKRVPPPPSADDESVVISDDEEREPSSFNPKSNAGLDEDILRNPSVRLLYGRDENVYVMDAKNTGNIGRFLNHSCAPNVYVQNVFVDTHDPRFSWICFFAQVYIRAGSELTWNYSYDIGSVPDKELWCKCAAPNCKGRLL